MPGSAQSFLSREESRTKQFKAIKGIWGDERLEHPNRWMGGHFMGSEAGPPFITRKFQAGASGEEVSSGKLPSCQNEKEATVLNCP